MLSNKNAVESNLRTKSIRKHSTRWCTRRKHNLQTQELHQCIESDGRSRVTSDILSDSECCIPNAIQSVRHPRRQHADYTANQRKQQRVGTSFKINSTRVFQKQNDKQRSKVQNGEYEGMGSAIGDDTAEGDRCGILNTKEMRRILNMVKKEKTKLSKLEENLLDFIKKRSESADLNQFKIVCKISSNHPILTLILTGCAKNVDQIENEIETKIMKIIRGNKLYFNDVKLVFDLTNMTDVYSFAMKTILKKWTDYIELRCSNVILLTTKCICFRSLKSNTIDFFKNRVFKCDFHIVENEKMLTNLLKNLL